MLNMDRSNGVNRTGVSDYGTSPGRHPATAMFGNRPGKGRRRWSIEENKVAMEFYFKSVPEKKRLLAENGNVVRRETNVESD